MNTVTNRLLVAFAPLLIVLLITLWSVPTAQAKPCCNNALDKCITDQCSKAREQCDSEGGLFLSGRDGSYSCSLDTVWYECMGDELNICIMCDYPMDACQTYAIRTHGVPLVRARATPFNKLTPAQQQQVRRMKARSKTRLVRGTTKSVQKTYDLRPILKRKKLRNGNNLVYTTPMGVRVYAMQRGGKVVGWSARNRHGRSSKLQLQRGATCSACIPNKFGRSARTGKCMQKIIVGAACPSFSMRPKSTIKKTTIITPIQKKK